MSHSKDKLTSKAEGSLSHSKDKLTSKDEGSLSHSKDKLTSSKAARTQKALPSDSKDECTCCGPKSQPLPLSLRQKMDTQIIRAPEFVPYTTEQKAAWAKAQATENAEFLSKILGFEVNPRLPFVLLSAARLVCESLTDRSKFVTRLCRRSEHFENSIKVLATAILHYDLAANLVATRRQGKLHRCENSLFVDLLKMPARTVDNAIYTLKRSGLYLSFEQREATADGYRGRASIKRLNMCLFNLLGLGQFASIQRNLAKQRAEIKKVTKTPIEKALDDYRKTDDIVREKRDKSRAEAAERRAAALRQQQAKNRTLDILAALDAGEDYMRIKARFTSPPDDIPY